MNKIIELRIEGPEENQKCLVEIELDFDKNPEFCTFEILSVNGNYLPERWEVTGAMYRYFNNPERKD